MSLDLPQPALYAAALILGLLVGSFLNVVAYRLPLQLQRSWRREALAWLATSDANADEPPHVANAARESLVITESLVLAESRITTESLVPTPNPFLTESVLDLGVPAANPADTEPFNLFVPRSRCPCCGAGIAARDNIPVLSWLWLRGHCRHCGERISWRYPLLELASGVLAVLVVASLGATPQALAGLVLGWSLLVLTVIDCDHQLLPDILTLPLLWLGLLVNTVGLFAPLTSAVAGAAAGYLVLWSMYWLFRLVTGRDGMGYGDFKLLAALGAWFGWEALPLLLLIAAGGGALYGTGAILLRRQERRAPFAFGPFLALAGAVLLLGGDALLAWAGIAS